MTSHAKLEKIQQLESKHIGVLANCYQYSARLFYHHIVGPRQDAERARQWLGSEVNQLVAITNEFSDFLKAHASEMQRARNQLAERMHSVQEVLAMYNMSITLFWSSEQMADKAVPDLDMTVGYFMERDGKIVWETYDGQLPTWRLALIDLLKSPNVKALYFLAGKSIWMRLPL